MKNNRGFMLVEVIVTSTVIVTALIGLYTSFNKLYKNYNIRNKYHNIDAIYSTKNMVDYLLDTELNLLLNEVFENNNYKYLIKEKNCEPISNNNKTLFPTDNFCSEIREFYQVENMMIVEYDKEVINEKLLPTIKNQTFKEYIEYVLKYYNITTSEDYGYLLLTEIKNGKEYYYANLRMR